MAQPCSVQLSVCLEVSPAVSGAEGLGTVEASCGGSFIPRRPPCPFPQWLRRRQRVKKTHQPAVLYLPSLVAFSQDPARASLSSRRGTPLRGKR